MDERAASLRNGVRFGSTGVRTRGYHDPAASFTSPHGFHICIRHGVPGHWRCSNPGGNFWSVYGRSFRFFGIVFRILLVGLQHFQRGIQVLLFSFPSYYIFLACTFVDFAPPHLLFFPRSASRLRPSSLWIWPRA